MQRIQCVLEAALTFGKTVVVKDIDGHIDQSIDQIVFKALYREDGLLKIIFGDRAVEYNQEFKLYLTTKLSNPHYLPEIFIRTLVINFTVTFDGLEE